MLAKGGSVTALPKAAPISHLVYHQYKYLIEKQTKKIKPRNLDGSVNTFRVGQGGQHQTDSPATDKTTTAAAALARDRQGAECTCPPFPSPQSWRGVGTSTRQVGGAGCMCPALPSPPSPLCPRAGAASVPGWGRSWGSPPHCGRVGLSAAWPQRGFGRVALTSGGSPLKDQRLLLYPALCPAGLSCGPGYSEHCHSLRHPRPRSLSSSHQMPVASHRCSSLWRRGERMSGEDIGTQQGTLRRGGGEKKGDEKMEEWKNDIMQMDGGGGGGAPVFNKWWDEKKIGNVGEGKAIPRVKEGEERQKRDNQNTPAANH